MLDFRDRFAAGKEREKNEGREEKRREGRDRNLERLNPRNIWDGLTPVLAAVIAV